MFRDRIGIIFPASEDEEAEEEEEDEDEDTIERGSKLHIELKVWETFFVGFSMSNTSCQMAEEIHQTKARSPLKTVKFGWFLFRPLQNFISAI